MADTELVEWARAAISTVRQAADDAQKATGGAVWTVDGGDIIGQHPTDRVVDWVYEDEARIHIGLNDPKAVADRCDADVAILDEHAVLSGCCVRCSQDEEQPQPLGWWMEAPCPTVRKVASGYRHQVPGWQEGWGP